jgi:hypothetical protein
VAENARLGPDLTHVGSRLQIGAGLLRNHRAALAGWIADPQALKPGVFMPAAAGIDGDIAARAGGLSRAPAMTTPTTPSRARTANWKSWRSLAHAARLALLLVGEQHEHRPAVHRHGAAVLRAGRGAGPADARAAGGAGQHLLGAAPTTRSSPCTAR